MGLFSFFKKSEAPKENTNSTILGMVLLEDNDSFDVKGTIKELKTKWNLDVSNSEVDNKTAVLDIDNYRVAFAVIPAPIPGDEVKIAAQNNYIWPEAESATAKHTGHLIVTIMNAGKSPIEENLLFSKVVSSVLNNSKSISIYIGSRTLVLSKEDYQSSVSLMSPQDLPLYIWLYMGIRQENNTTSMYTYGLTEFGKSEMEIVDSKRPVEELHEMMFNMTHYVLAYDVTLNSGETIGISAEQKLKITESEGKYVEGKTLKIEY